MPRGRIQHRTWFVKFGLAVSGVAALNRSEHAQSTAEVLADEIKRCLKDLKDSMVKDDGSNCPVLGVVSRGGTAAVAAVPFVTEMTAAVPVVTAVASREESAPGAP